MLCCNNFSTFSDLTHKQIFLLKKFDLIIKIIKKIKFFVHLLQNFPTLKQICDQLLGLTWDTQPNSRLDAGQYEAAEPLSWKLHEPTCYTTWAWVGGLPQGNHASKQQDRYRDSTRYLNLGWNPSPHEAPHGHKYRDWSNDSHWGTGSSEGQCQTSQSWPFVPFPFNFNFQQPALKWHQNRQLLMKQMPQCHCSQYT